jgi:hypothetical protein
MFEMARRIAQCLLPNGQDPKAGSPALKLRLPRCNLIGVNVELLGKLRQCPIALDGGKRPPRLESRCVVPARSSLQGLS